MKLYADEEGHEAIRALDALAVSAIARVEVPAALWRKQRLGELSAAHARILTAAFESDFLGADGAPPRFAVVTVAAEILEDAAGLVALHALRAYDAVQLASARAVRAVDPDCHTFACFDGELRAAAAAVGLDLLP